MVASVFRNFLIHRATLKTDFRVAENAVVAYPTGKPKRIFVWKKCRISYHSGIFNFRNAKLSRTEAASSSEAF